jgi:hypothetical protein
MAGRVPISGVKRCDQGSRERKVCALEVLICLYEILAQSAFLLIQDEKALRSQCWSEE